MSVYMVFTRHKTIDQRELEAYSKEVLATFAGHPVKLLARYGARGFGGRRAGGDRDPGVS
jgi:hypothetical protein